MSTLDSVTIPEGHFSGNASITEGNVKDSAIGDLRTILNKAISDLEKLQIPVTEVGALQSASFVDGGGATIDVDIAIPTGVTIKILDVHVLVKGTGTVGDLVQLKKEVTGPTVTAISDAIDISAATAKDIVRAAEVDTAQYSLDGTAGDILRVAITDGAGADVPATETIVSFVRTA